MHLYMQYAQDWRKFEYARSKLNELILRVRFNYNLLVNKVGRFPIRIQKTYIYSLILRRTLNHKFNFLNVLYIFVKYYHSIKQVKLMKKKSMERD